MARTTSRRQFVKQSAAFGAAMWVGGQVRADDRAANSRVRYASIGVGGKGDSDSADCARFGDVVAICDIDDSALDKRADSDAFRNAARYNDFRQMLSEMGDSIDAVTVSTPDHCHAPAAAMAMKMGKHCFVQKPLTHTVWEARRLQEIAKEMNVATIMGNQGTANSGVREAAAILKGGHLGNITEVHVFTNRPVWPQGLGKPTEEAEAPPWIHWDLWLGPAAERGFAEAYHPFKWRGWWDFGTGALGDMACHTFNMPFMGVELKNPTAIQAWTTGHGGYGYPQKSKIKFDFPKNDWRGDVAVWWYDGGNLPDVSLLKGFGFRGDTVNPRGAIIVCEKGTLFSWDDYGDEFVILDGDGKEMEKPKVEFERSPGHFQEWHESIIGERKRAVSNFEEYAGPLTETILLGNLAVWSASGDPAVAQEYAGKRIEWDAATLTATNAPEVMSVVNKPYREGWGEALQA
jgi:predicted dehydrogenase